MVSIICRTKGSARVRASWGSVQKALFDQAQARSSRKRFVKMDGDANLLFTGAKAIHKGNGIWLVYGYSSNDSDVTDALARMKESWPDRMTREGRDAA